MHTGLKWVKDFIIFSPWTQDVNETYTRCPRRLMNFLCMFILRPVSRGYEVFQSGVSKERTDFRAVFRAQSDICDGPFFGK